MGSKNICITDDVYDELTRQKLENESFSDVLKRLLRQRRDPFIGFGIWKEVPAEEWDEFETVIEKGGEARAQRAAGKLLEEWED